MGYLKCQPLGAEGALAADVVQRAHQRLDAVPGRHDAVVHEGGFAVCLVRHGAERHVPVGGQGETGNSIDRVDPPPAGQQPARSGGKRFRGIKKTQIFCFRAQHKIIHLSPLLNWMPACVAWGMGMVNAWCSSKCAARQGMPRICMGGLAFWSSQTPI